MDKFTLWKKIVKPTTIDKVLFIQERCRDKVVLDLGCVRHSAEFAEKDPNWLHMKILEVAKKVVGVDFLQQEVEKLRKKGFDNILWGDVTKPLDIDEKFDVIVAGDLIEHLDNFAGFFDNCNNLLRDDGNLIISTPNPFYYGLFHGAVFRGVPLISPEHTCWIDPQCLSQLSTRFGYTITEVSYIKQSWNLLGYIWETENTRFDVLNHKWSNDSRWFFGKIRVAATILAVFYIPYKFFSGANSKLVKHSDYIAVLKKE